MNALEITLILVAAVAGTLVAAFTTVYGAVRHSCEQRDRQLFNAYVRTPHKVEAWLVHGALEDIRESMERKS